MSLKQMFVLVWSTAQTLQKQDKLVFKLIMYAMHDGFQTAFNYVPRFQSYSEDRDVQYTAVLKLQNSNGSKKKTTPFKKVLKIGLLHNLT